MKRSSWREAGIALAFLAATASAGGGDGESKGFAFGTAPVNSMGVKSMAELRGKPVLIDFWGTR
jgi:hypothetical protein